MPEQNTCSMGREGCDWPYQTFHVCVDLSYTLPEEGLKRRGRKERTTNATHPKRRYTREKRWDE